MTSPARSSAVALRVSAAALGAALLWSASSAWSQPAAHDGSSRGSGMVARTGDITALTVNIGNEDALVALDGRSEQIYVYRAGVREGIQIIQRLDIAQTFTDARARFLGTP